MIYGFRSCLILGLSVSLGSILIPSFAHADQCAELVKLYQSSVEQYELAQKSYLKAGCLESPEEKEQCKGLEAAAREMRATVDMFATRANLLKCKPQDLHKTPANRCTRLKSLYQRAHDQLKVLELQYQEQSCAERRYTPACKALEKTMFKPRELVKAARREALKAECTLD